MEKKPGWDYIYIDSLQQHIAINQTTDVLYTEDKTRYTPEECQLLRTIDFNLPLQIHIIKKLFTGTIISIK